MHEAAPKREFRPPLNLWRRAKQRAIEEDVTVSTLVVRALRRYLDGAPAAPAGTPEDAPG